MKYQKSNQIELRDSVVCLSDIIIEGVPQILKGQVFKVRNISFKKDDRWLNIGIKADDGWNHDHEPDCYKAYSTWSYNEKYFMKISDVMFLKKSELEKKLSTKDKEDTDKSSEEIARGSHVTCIKAFTIGGAPLLPAAYSFYVWDIMIHNKKTYLSIGISTGKEDNQYYHSTCFIKDKAWWFSAKYFKRITQFS